MGRAFSATNSTRKQNESEMFKDRKISDLKEPSNVFKAFLDETSLHGWKYLNKDGNITLKLLWMLVLALACSASIFGMYYYGWQFGTAKTMTTMCASHNGELRPGNAGSVDDLVDLRDAVVRRRVGGRGWRRRRPKPCLRRVGDGRWMGDAMRT